MCKISFTYTVCEGGHEDERSADFTRARCEKCWRLNGDWHSEVDQSLPVRSHYKCSRCKEHLQSAREDLENWYFTFSDGDQRF
jgi:DNA-directed RNA polymerase subunit RPC12/RpoP